MNRSLKGRVASPLATRLTSLVIVLLSIDVSAGAILTPVQVPALPSGHFAVGFGSRLFGVRYGLLSFEPPGFSPGQFAAMHAPTNAALLVVFAPIDSWRVLCESGNAQAEREYNGQHYTGDIFHAVSLRS
jgi:hypothetical protein